MGSRRAAPRRPTGVADRELRSGRRQAQTRRKRVAGVELRSQRRGCGPEIFVSRRQRTLQVGHRARPAGTVLCGVQRNVQRSAPKREREYGTPRDNHDISLRGQRPPHRLVIHTDPGQRPVEVDRQPVTVAHPRGGMLAPPRRHLAIVELPSEAQGAKHFLSCHNASRGDQQVAIDVGARLTFGVEPVRDRGAFQEQGFGTNLLKAA